MSEQVAQGCYQWNIDATRDSNRGPRVRIPSALTTRPLSRVVIVVYQSHWEVHPVHLMNTAQAMPADLSLTGSCSIRHSPSAQTLIVILPSRGG